MSLTLSRGRWYKTNKTHWSLARLKLMHPIRLLARLASLITVFLLSVIADAKRPERPPPVFANSSASASAQCLDDEGAPVDWWVILKGHYGFEYVYTDSNRSGTFSEVRPNLNDKTTGALSLTMQAVQGGAYNDTLGYFAYNDQPPKKRPNWAMDLASASSDSDSVAHAK
jgi:hypothetical protein